MKFVSARQFSDGSLRFVVELEAAIEEVRDQRPDPDDEEKTIEVVTVEAVAAVTENYNFGPQPEFKTGGTDEEHPGVPYEPGEYVAHCRAEVELLTAAAAPPEEGIDLDEGESLEFEDAAIDIAAIKRAVKQGGGRIELATVQESIKK